MKFIEARTGTAPDVRGGAGVHSGKAKPDWLKEWIANKGKYVRLACGHRVDLNDRTVLTEVVKQDGAKRVWCYMHEEVYDIEKSIGLFEWHYGFPPPVQPEFPEF